MTRGSGIDDFTFLTHDFFLLVRPTGRFEVYTFMEPVKSSTVPVLRATYAFPALSDGYMYRYISMSSNPTPGYVPRSWSDNNAIPRGNRQLYYPNPDERIHACCLYILNSTVEENQNHHDVHSFVFFLNIQSLLNPPAAWLVKKRSLHFYNSHSGTTPTPRPTPRNTAAMDTGSVSSASGSSASSSPIDNPMAPPNPPTLSSSSSSSLFSSIYPPFPTFNHFPTHTSSPIPRINLPPLSSPSTSSSCRSGSSRTLIASLSPGVYIPWEVWGPQSTRWFEECITDWQHAIYGLRTVESVGVTKWRDGDSNTNLSSPPTQPGNLSMPNGPTSNGVAYKSVAVQATEGSSATMVDVVEELPSIQDDDANENAGIAAGSNVTPRERSLLRIRDFNPYSFPNEFHRLETLNGKGKHKARWRAPRLVTESSTTSVKGVFKHDIESSLPYMEVVSEDTFEVTDVMMDDCRLLLLKVRHYYYCYCYCY